MSPEISDMGLGSGYVRECMCASLLRLMMRRKCATRIGLPRYPCLTAHATLLVIWHQHYRHLHSTIAHFQMFRIIVDITVIFEAYCVQDLYYPEIGSHNRIFLCAINIVVYSKEWNHSCGLSVIPYFVFGNC